MALFDCVRAQDCTAEPSSVGSSTVFAAVGGTRAGLHADMASVAGVSTGKYLLRRNAMSALSVLVENSDGNRHKGVYAYDANKRG